MTGIDPIDRRDVAQAFGVDAMEWSTASAWAASLRDDERPGIVVEAVGHQAGTLEDAVEAVAPGGTVLAFGVPDETHYAFPFARFFRKDATLVAGVTRDRRRSLATARDYLLEHRALLDAYVTDVVPVAEAQAAFELGGEAGRRPAQGRAPGVTPAAPLERPLNPEAYPSYMTAAPTRTAASEDRIRGLALVAAMVVVMWVVEAVDALGAHLDNDGIHPRDVDGLPGIAFAPFLHASWAHLIGNTIPFLILGFMIALGGLARTAAVTVIVALVAGFGTWVFAPAHTNHIGASGVVFGFATYLVARGIFSRRPLHLVVGLARARDLRHDAGVRARAHARHLMAGPSVRRDRRRRRRARHPRLPSAISSSFVTVFQLRSVAATPSFARPSCLASSERPDPVRVEDVDLAAGELQLVDAGSRSASSFSRGVGVRLAGQERDVEVLRVRRHLERVGLDRGGELVARAHHDLRVDAELLLDLLLELLLERGRLRAAVKTTLPLCTSVSTSV